jgi:CRISPR/Cas system-associated endonuclease Cas1
MSLVFDLIEEFRPVAVYRPLVAFARKEKEAVRNFPIIGMKSCRSCGDK